MASGVGGLRILNDAGRIPLLTPSEEIHLGRCIQAMASLKDKAKPTRDEQRIIRRGIKARDRMIAANIKLAAAILRPYQSQGNGNVLQLDLEELMQEAMFGLARAADKFDPERGYKFSTYAYAWIKQSIYRCITRNGRLIRPPAHIAEKMYTFNKLQSDLIALYGRTPTQSEMAAALKMSLEEYQYALQMTASRPASLDAAVLEDGTPILDSIPDPQSSDPDGLYSKIVDDIDSKKLQDVIESLHPECRNALIRRYGLNGTTPCTYTEIARTDNVSRERIRQRVQKAENIIRLSFAAA